MIRHVYCGKKTKIYIPKIRNPKILTCCVSQGCNKEEKGDNRKKSE